MITIGQLVDLCNHGDNLIDTLCGGNTSQTADKLKAILRDPDKVARLHQTLASLETDLKKVRGIKIEVKP